MAEPKPVLQVDFGTLFLQKNWFFALKKVVETPELRQQFVTFLRSDAFITAMKQAAKTDDGRKNIVLALKDDKIRGVMLDNFKYSPVRWAIGDLYNSPEGQKVMKELIRPSGAQAVLDIVKAMTGTKLSMDETRKDFEHYKKKEDENIHARPERLQWLAEGLSSDAKAKEFMKELETDAGKGKMIALLRTREVRQAIDNMISTKDGRRRLAEMLKSKAGYEILDTAMRSPEGVNIVGYLWNMPNGKELLKENMMNPSGIKTMYKLFSFQERYNKLEKQMEEKLKGVPKITK
jgi:hypothetical protein